MAVWILFRFNPFSANSEMHRGILHSFLLWLGVTDSGTNLFFCNEATRKKELNQKPSDTTVQDVD